MFLKNISLSAISSNLLLNESDKSKEIIQQAFMNGLNKGVVKPFRSRVVTSSLGANKMFDAIR